MSHCRSAAATWQKNKLLWIVDQLKIRSVALRREYQDQFLHLLLPLWQLRKKSFQQKERKEREREREREREIGWDSFHVRSFSSHIHSSVFKHNKSSDPRINIDITTDWDRTDPSCFFNGKSNQRVFFRWSLGFRKTHKYCAFGEVLAALL